MKALDAAFLAWGLASAIAVVALGAFALSGGRTRPRGALAFGLFCVFWGLQVIAGSIASVVADAGAATKLYLVFIATSLPTAYLLTEFALAQAETADRRWLRGALRLGVFTVGFAAACVLLLAPELLFDGLRPAFGTWQMARGPLFTALVAVPHFFAFGLALALLAGAAHRATSPRLVVRLQTLVAGIGVYVGFVAANNFVYFLDAVRRGDTAPDLAFTLLLAGLTTVVLRLGLAARTAAATGSVADRRGWNLVALALLAPLAWGAVEAILTVTLFPRLQTVGLWRLAGVGVIAYGIARWRIWDLPQRAQTVALRATGATAAAAGGAAAYGAASLATTSAAVPWVAALLVAGVSLVPGLRLARRLFGGADLKLSPSEVEARLYGQRLDAYRAALEASLGRGTLDEDRPFLDALRERFRIGEAEERVLLHYARASVVIPREAGADTVYERLRLLGEGGAGRTWLARDRARDRLVVLKEPLERWQRESTIKEMVLREARLAARVRHPNVVRVEEVVEIAGSPVLVMEYLEGGTLGDVLRARGTLPWRDAAALVRDVCAGVEAIHAAGIVHRDVKPSNILLDADGTAKVGDFGIALPATSGKTMIDAASTTRAGTLSYMAPEVRTGAALGDRRADVYACAAVLHECLYGSPPAPDAPVVLRGDVPAVLATALARGLAPRPDDRFQTARAFADVLDRASREAGA